MRTKTDKSKDGSRDFNRSMLRSATVSMFWGVIAERRKQGILTLHGLANTLGIDKSVVSRWFGSPPNWTLNTVADLACALDLDIEITARSRTSGTLYTMSGPDEPVSLVASRVPASRAIPGTEGMMLASEASYATPQKPVLATD